MQSKKGSGKKSAQANGKPALKVGKKPAVAIAYSLAGKSKPKKAKKKK